MSVRKFRGSRVFAVAMLATLLLMENSAKAEDDDSIIGSWDVTVFFTTPPGFPPVKAFYSFTGGGAFVMTANNVDPRAIGPGHGAWTRTGEQEFGLTFMRFRFDPTTDPQTYLGTLKGRWSVLHLNDRGDEWTSDRWIIDFFDPDGRFIGRPFEGTAIAHRIVVEPLE